MSTKKNDENESRNRGLTTTEVAERLGCSERKARELMDSTNSKTGQQYGGAIPSYSIGSDLRVDSLDLERWIAAAKVKAL
ncbi:MAG: helix-turn-helix domain-containing protein [Bdellovibrionales bacterium]|nr:helix-turn-helix domain-containing protein [Bdellovibrionales bacterium]